MAWWLKSRFAGALNFELLQNQYAHLLRISEKSLELHNIIIILLLNKIKIIK